MAGKSEFTGWAEYKELSALRQSFNEGLPDLFFVKSWIFSRWAPWIQGISTRINSKMAHRSFSLT
jgi:hypothetical protein